MNENSNQKVSQALKPDESCPSLDELIGLTSGKEGDLRRLEVEAHAAGCAHCSTELALFREFDQPTIRPEEKPHVEAIAARLRQNSPVPSTTSWWKSLWTIRGMAPASVAMAAILVGLFIWAPGRTTPGGAPNVSGGDDVLRSARVTVVGPIGFVSSAPSRLEWVAVKGAVKYQVSLSEVDRTPVWSATVESPTATLPADVLAKVVPLKTFVWQVSAVNASGSVIGNSGSQRFRLENRPSQ